MPNYNFNNNNNYQPYTPYQTRLNQYAFVNGIEGAKSYQVFPNQMMLLMDSDNPICYMKQTDNIGKATIRYFKIDEIDENKAKEILSTPTPTIEYALKSDVDSISLKLDELSTLIKEKIGE